MNERSIFLEALEKGTPAGRSAYLEQACGGDAAMRQRVEALLASHDRAGSFLGMPAPQRLARQLGTRERAGTSGGPPGADEDTSPPALGGATVDMPAPASARALSGAPHVPGYDVLGILGQGGMGVVYKARHLRSGRTVALKMIPADAEVGEEHLARFRAEAEAVARLEHPNIVKLYEVIENDRRPYLALEYVPGVSLHERLKDEPLSVEGAARLVETLARAIHYAHQNGIVHRDLKPANVLLQRTAVNLAGGGAPPGLWVPKITDFGLAKRLDADQGQTPSGAILGTPSYMAPEQARGTSKRSGPTADIYSLGAILYELLVGRPPFRGETILDTLVKAVSQKPVSPRRLGSDIPTELERICLKCLQKDPAQRYASAEALAEDLRRFLAGGPVPDVPPSLADPEQVRGRAGGLRKRLLLGAGVAALLLVGLLVLLRGASRPGAPPARGRQQQLPVAQASPPAAGEQARPLAQNGQKSPPPPVNGKGRQPENGKGPAQNGNEPPPAAGKSSGTDPAGRHSAPPALSDIQVSLPRMPAVGRLAVQASPRVHARYAEGSRAVVLVLDCSGSMMHRLPGGRTRFAEATRALLEVLAGIPKDTQVSVWAFSHRDDIDTGRKMVDDPEKSIQRVHLAGSWDPTPANLALVKRRIALLVPWNHTPIVRSLMEARKDFTDKHSFKTLVVLTDGMDNRFEAQPGGRWNGDPVYNPEGKLTIPAFLAQAFTRDNIAIRLVGFQLPANEQAEVTRQFRRPLENLPTTGKFYLVDDPKQLIETLRESLEQRLSFTLEGMDGRPVKGLEGRVDISRVGQDSRWITLSPGYYWVVIDALKRVRQKVEIRRGDRLRLTLDEKGDGIVLLRGLVQHAFAAWKPLHEARAGDWLLKVLQNQRSLQEDTLQMMVTAEAVRDREVGGVRTLGHVRPSLILFQVRPQGDPKARPVSLRYSPLADWTAPAWGLDIKPWDRRARPVLEAFWSEDPPPVVGTLRRGQHFGDDLQVLPQGGAVEVQLSKGARGPVQFLSLNVEKHLMETHDGKRREVSCLVVRLTFPLGKPVMAQLPGFRGGQEHRFSSEAGKYTGIFWEMTPQQAQQTVETFHLISLTGFREAALDSGQHARIELGEPNNDPRPCPPQ